MDRSIIHINVADFAAAVERVVDSRLRGRPVIIAPEGAPRAAVYDMSEEAFRAGVRKGMALRRAVRLCADASILPPHPARYEQAMADLFKRAAPYSPLIEPGDRDGHLFLDVTGTHRLFGPPVDVAWRLRKQVKTDLGLDPIWSVAPNKLLAKVASRLVKPVGEYIVTPGDEEALLAPLPLSLIPGIERNDLRRLSEFNLTRVYQLAAMDIDHIRVPFGARADFFFEAVRGIDPSPVRPAGEKPSGIGVDHEFGNDTNDAPTLNRALYRLVERAGRTLRKRRLATRRTGIILDHSDGIRRVRQETLNPASANDLTLFETARSAFNLAWTRRVRIRNMRLVCDRLVFPPAKIELFPAHRRETKKRTGLITAMDNIRNRFGMDAICMGRTLAA